MKFCSFCIKYSQIQFWAKMGPEKFGWGKYGTGQIWVGANMGLGKFGLGQIWDREKLGFGQIWLGKVGPGKLGRANLGWAKMA